MTPIRQIDLARRWGIDKSSVCRWVRRGMPLTSVEAAERWRMDHAPPKDYSRFGLPGPSATDPAEPGAEVGGNGAGSVSGVLGRLREAERLAWAMVQNAARTGEHGRLSSANKAYAVTTMNLMAAEKKAAEVELAAGRMLPTEDILVMINDRLGRVVAQVKNWPVTLASRCNPQDPQLAREVLREAVRELCDRMRAIENQIRWDEGRMIPDEEPPEGGESEQADKETERNQDHDRAE